MLKNKNDLENTNSAYRFVGFDDNGNKEYLVNIKENNHSNKTIIDFDDALLDDWGFDDEFSVNTIERTPEILNDDKILAQNDFFRMEWKEIQY